MKTDLEVEVEVDLRQLGKVIIFRDRQTDKQNLPIIFRYGQTRYTYIAGSLSLS